MKTYQNSNIKIIYVFALILLLFVGCENDRSRFPYARVNVTLDIGTELNNMVQGEYVFIGPEDCSEAESCGYGGLIIFRASQNNFQAFDRSCTYNPKEKCLLEPFEGDRSNNILSCPCCGSLFNLGESGRVLQGPAIRDLKQYQTTKQSNQLRVTNY
jgi:nitrite reductase/ring-hydroxylating ferredoxin subunit